VTEWDVDISEKRQNDGHQHPFHHVMHAAPSDTGAGVVMDISPRIISVHYIRIHFGYEPGTRIQNAL